MCEQKAQRYGSTSYDFKIRVLSRSHSGILPPHTPHSNSYSFNIIPIIYRTFISVSYNCLMEDARFLRGLGFAKTKEHK
jgi:hypothetical protein